MSHQVLIAGKFKGGITHDQIGGILSKFEDVTAVSAKDDWNILIAADDQFKKLTRAFSQAVENKLPTVREAWVHALKEINTWLDPTLYLNSETGSLPATEEQPDEEARRVAAAEQEAQEEARAAAGEAVSKLKLDGFDSILTSFP